MNVTIYICSVRPRECTFFFISLRYCIMYSYPPCYLIYPLSVMILLLVVVVVVVIVRVVLVAIAGNTTATSHLRNHKYRYHLQYQVYRSHSLLPQPALVYGHNINNIIIIVFWQIYDEPRQRPTVRHRMDMNPMVVTPQRHHRHHPTRMEVLTFRWRNTPTRYPWVDGLRM